MPALLSPPPDSGRWAHFPAALAFVVNAVATVALLVAGGAAAGGYAYPLDDTYIHMATAWNWFSTGVYGLNPGEFSSPSTSPAWVAALAAGFAVVGKRTAFPLGLELASAAWMLAVANDRLRRAGLSVTGRTASLLALLVTACLPVVTATAMEHLAQTALALMLVAMAEDRLAGRERSPLAFAVVGAILPLLRVETVLLVGLVAVSMRRDPLRAGALAVGAGLSAVAFGAWNHAQGGLWLPNTLIMKSIAGRGGWEAVLRENLAEGSAVFLWVGMAAVIGRPGPARTWLVAVAAGQFLAGSFGWLARYEAWLVVWATLLVAEALPRQRASAIAAAFAGIVACARGAVLAEGTVSREVYIHDLKVVPGVTLARLAPSATVCVHDVGAIAWYGGGVRVVDVAGLGTNAVAKAQLEGALDRQTLGRLCREGGGTLAFTSEAWLGDGRPEGWEPVGTLAWGPTPGQRLSAWRLDALTPDARDPGRRWMEASVAEMAGRGVFEVTGSTVVPFEHIAVASGLVAPSGRALGMFTNATVSFAAPSPGELWLTLSGTDGTDGPAQVTIGTHRGLRTLDLPKAPQRLSAGAVDLGEAVSIAFVNDQAADGLDRNAFLWRVEIEAR